MATEAERIRQEIATTRAELTRDVDRLAEQTTPGRLADRFMGGLRSLKERTIGTSERAASTVAGAASDATERLQEFGAGAAETAHGVGKALQQAPGTVVRATQGSPVGVGLIAFGGGLLAAALIPETEAERHAVQQLSENVGPVVAPLTEASRALVADVRDTVESAAEQVRVAAVDAADNVGSAATAGAADVRSAATEGMHDVRTAAQGEVEQLRRND